MFLNTNLQLTAKQVANIWAVCAYPLYAITWCKVESRIRAFLEIWPATIALPMRVSIHETNQWTLVGLEDLLTYINQRYESFTKIFNKHAHTRQCVHMCIYIYTYARICTYKKYTRHCEDRSESTIQIYVSMYAKYLNMYIYIYICVKLYIYIYISKNVNIYVYIYIYIYVYMYILTHIYIYTSGYVSSRQPPSGHIWSPLQPVPYVPCTRSNRCGSLCSFVSSRCSSSATSTATMRRRPAMRRQPIRPDGRLSLGPWAVGPSRDFASKAAVG